jgi:hypothetical protein
LNISPPPEQREGILTLHGVSLAGAAGRPPAAGWQSSRRRRSESIGALGTLAVPADQGSLKSRRSGVAGLTLVLYVATLSVDAIRKVAGLPASTIGVIYVIAALMYIAAIPTAVDRPREASRPNPRTLPIWLFMLSLWCLAVALVQHVPRETAMLGWMSYVFFVPLLYVGAELAADDRLAVKALRVVALGGGIVGAGAIASALLGQSAPALLQPIIPAVGIHSFTTTGNIYLSPSIFASAEEASEQLLIALFAWAALSHLPNGISRRKHWMFLGVLIAAGLIVTARRTDIDVAIAGIIAALILGRTRIPVPAERFAAPARTRSRPGVAIFAATAAAVALISFLGEAKLASFLTSGSPLSRVEFMFSLPSKGSVVGQGTGTSTQGVTVLGATPLPNQGSYASYVLHGRTFFTAEGGLAKTWLELGFMGVVLFGAVFWVALAPAIRSLRRLDGAGIALTMLAIALGVVFLKGHQSLDDPLIQPLFWLAVGGIWGRMRAVALIRRPDPGAASRSRPGHPYAS